MRRAISVIAAVTLLGLATSFCPPAWAAPRQRVLVISGSNTPAPAGLIEALRIQLGQAAEVVSVDSPGSTSDASADEDAEQQKRAAHAAIVLWIDDTSEPPQLYARTGTASSARLELGALSPTSVERDRVLALKIGELLEREPGEPRGPVSAAAAGRHRTRAFVDMGVRVWSAGSAAQQGAGPAVAIGPRWEWPGSVLEAHGSFVFDRDIHARAPVGEVDVETTFVGLGGRALWFATTFGIGPYFEAGVDVLRAHGATADQRQGAQELLVPTAELGCDLRLRLAPNFELRASAGPQLSFVRERLALEGRQVLDLGWLHPSGAFSGLLIFP